MAVTVMLALAGVLETRRVDQLAARVTTASA